jgi:hypothetical protein
MVRLRTSTRSRWHLSYLFSRFIGEPRGFDRWAGSGVQTTALMFLLFEEFFIELF